VLLIAKVAWPPAKNIPIYLRNQDYVDSDGQSQFRRLQWPDLKENELCYRPSMKKFDSCHAKLGIVRVRDLLLKFDQSLTEFVFDYDRSVNSQKVV
jgi:hypothetical protein